LIVIKSFGLKAPRGMGWLANPKKALYNRVYNRTSKGCMVTLIAIKGVPIIFGLLLFRILEL